MLTYLFSQIALAPPGTQACTLDIAKFHRTCPVLPDHKPWLVVQGRPGEFYIDHTHPFGASCASSNAGMIANALVDIWMAQGVKPILKYEDDLNIFRFPTTDGPFHDGEYHYLYDRPEALRRVEDLKVPWHPEKGTPFFSDVFTFIGLSWDISHHLVSLPENKRLKFLRRVNDFIFFFERKQCHLRDIQRIHGSLCYISFVYTEGRSRLPSLSNFAATFKGDEYLARFPPRSVFSDLRWWSETLENPSFFRHLIPRGPTLNPGIFVDASTSWGIGIIFGDKWISWQLAPSWKVPGRDICWLETLAVEFAVYILAAQGFRDCSVIIHSDNQGTIGSIQKGRSPNIDINLSVRRACSILIPHFITPILIYVPSKDNLADPLSRGELGPHHTRLHKPFQLPDELRNFFLNAY